MCFELNFLEKERRGFCKSLKQFRINCWIKRKSQGYVWDHTEDSVTEVTEVFLLNKISRGNDFELFFDQGIKLFCHGSNFLVKFRYILGKLILDVEQNLKPIPESNWFELGFDWVIKFIEQIPFELYISSVRNDIVSGDVGVPALLFVQVLVNWLTSFWNGYWFTALSEGLFKVVFFTQSDLSVHWHLNLFVDDLCSALNKWK